MATGVYAGRERGPQRKKETGWVGDSISTTDNQIRKRRDRRGDGSWKGGGGYPFLVPQETE